jgi:small-conductance mechanosensitive channel
MKILDISGFVNRHAKKFVLIGGWILAAALLYIRPPVPQNGQENEKAPDDWARLVLEDQRYLKVVGYTTKARIQHAKERLDLYGASLDGLRQKTSAYSFMLNSYEDRDDVFELMLCCRQISSLKAEHETLKAQVTRLQDIILRTNTLNRVIQTLEEEKARHTALGLVSAIDQNIAERRANLEQIVSLQQPLQAFIEKMGSLGVVVDELYERSNAKRDAAIQGMFLVRTVDVRRGVASFVRYLPLWQVKISGWWRTQFPQTLDFWLRFLVLLALMTALFTYLKVRWVKPFLLRSALVANEPSALSLFSFGYGLLTLAVVFYLCVLSAWLSEGAANAFTQVYQVLFSTGVLVLAMLMRNATSRETRGVIRFVMPVIVQHLLCASLYITLVPRIPLLVILPVINLVVAVWLIHCLMSERHDTFTFMVGALTILQSFISTWMVISGFVYFAFTITLGWQVLVAQVMLAIVVSLNIYHLIAREVARPFKVILLKRLVLPLVWVALLVSLFAWLTQTYHLQDYFEKLFRMPLPFGEVAVITMNRMLLIALLALFLQFAIKFVSEQVRYRLKGKDESDVALYTSTLTIGRYLSWGFFVIVTCVICQVNAKSMVVMLGGFGLGLGLALKGVAENFFSGITLLVGQEIRPGDLVEIGGGQFATVQKINFSRTIVETNDGAVITYPNAVVTSKEFRNWTRNDKYRRYDIAMDVAYGADLELVKRLLLQAALEQESTARDSLRKPMVFIQGFQESAIRFIVRIWIEMPVYTEVSTQLQVRIYALLKHNNISIPFPQLDVYLKNSPLNLEK